MIQSMTGFGKSVVTLPQKKITIQLKSLNSKRFDLYTHIPTVFREKELEIRKIISKSLQRGKVDLSINIEHIGNAASTKINKEIVRHYVEELEGLLDPAFDIDEVDLLKIAMKLPDTLKTEEEAIEEEEYTALEDGIQEAVDRINQYRTDEGKSIEADFRERVGNIRHLLEEVEKIDSNRVEEKREKLRAGFEELKENVDENRFEQELIYYIEKYDINEEKSRLKNHLDYFLETVDLPQSGGKKLGFIAQEMGREINTMGSKSNYAEMQRLVVQMKDELEKIKEQVLNAL